MDEGKLDLAWIERSHAEGRLAPGQNLYDQSPFSNYIPLAAVRLGVDSGILRSLVTYAADALRLREKFTMRQIRRKARKLGTATGVSLDPVRIGEEISLITGELATDDPAWYLYPSVRDKAVYNDDGSVRDLSPESGGAQTAQDYSSWRRQQPTPKASVILTRDGGQFVSRASETFYLADVED